MLLNSVTYHIPFAEVAVRMLNMTAWQQIEKLNKLEESWQKEQELIIRSEKGLINQTYQRTYGG